MSLSEMVFIVGGFFAPLQISVFKAFTVYDLFTVMVAFLLVAERRRMRPIPTSLRVATGLLLIAAFVSAFRALYPLDAVTQGLQYAFLLLVQIPVVLTIASSRAAVDGALIMLIAGFLWRVAHTAAMGQYIGAHRLVTDIANNPNQLAIPAAILAPIALYYASRAWRNGRRIVALVGGGGALYGMLWAIAASGSRSSAMGGLVSLFVYLVFRRGIDRRILGRVLIFLAVLATLGLVVYQTSIFPSALKDRVQGTIDTPSVVMDEYRVTDSRPELDRGGLNAFEESPLVGTGLDNFRYVSQFYGVPVQPYLSTSHAVHNVYINFLAETGVFGALAFLFIIGRWFVLVFRAQSFTSDPRRREFLWALIAGIVATLTMGMATPVVVLRREFWLFYALGIAVAAGLALESRVRAKDSR
jgi:O-antigen ligase